MFAYSAAMAAKAAAQETQGAQLLATMGQLTSTWTGTSSDAAKASIAQMRSWIDREVARTAATGAAAAENGRALETARATTPPVPAIAENQTECVSLVASNIIGQNTGAIIANRTAYFGGLWPAAAAAGAGYMASTLATTASLQPPEPPRPMVFSGGNGVVAAGVANAYATAAAAAPASLAQRAELTGYSMQQLATMVLTTAAGAGTWAEFEAAQPGREAPVAAADAENRAGEKQAIADRKSNPLDKVSPDQLAQQGGMFQQALGPLTSLPSTVSSAGGQVLQVPQQFASMGQSFTSPLSAAGGLQSTLLGATQSTQAPSAGPALAAAPAGLGAGAGAGMGGLSAGTLPASSALGAGMRSPLAWASADAGRVKLPLSRLTAAKAAASGALASPMIPPMMHNAPVGEKRRKPEEKTETKSEEAVPDFRGYFAHEDRSNPPEEVRSER
ncbi:hypothetical protein TSHO111613_23095 [Tsukamurella hominis]